MARFKFSAPVLGGGTVKPTSWGKRFPGRGGDVGAGAFNMRFTNLDSWLKSIEEDVVEVLDEAAEALDEATKKHILKPSLLLCPKKTGALRASAWKSVVVERARLKVSVGYDTDYAIYVHERFANHEPPTQWKFLETPMAQNGGKVYVEVLQSIQEALQ